MAIFSTVAGAIGTLFGLSTVAVKLIAVGLSLAAKLAFSYLTRPKQRKYTAVQGEVQLGGDVPVTAQYGTGGKNKGHRVYYAKWGGGNKFNAEVFVLSNGWCDGLEPEVHFYGEKHTLTSQSPRGGEAARYFVDGFGSKLEIRFYDGRPGQTPDARLASVTASSGTPWDGTNAKLSGMAYVIVERIYDSALFEKGAPDIEFTLRGLREYDPRFDSTVPGGSGSQRLNNPATWVHTKNPAIHRLNYLIGLRGTLSGRTLIGLGYDINRIDLASHMVAATVCDTTRTVGSRTIKTYEASLFVQASDDHIEVLAEFEDAMAGYAANLNGLSGIIPGAPQIVSATLTANDIRVDDSQEVSFRRSAYESVNMLSGQFTSPEAQWNPISLKTVTVNADVTADGRRRPNSNDFLQVTDPDIAQYLLNIRYRQYRKAGKASIPVSRRFGLKTSLGDWISWNGKTWLVTGRSFDELLRFRLDLAETGSDIYSEDGIEAGPIVIPSSAPTNPSLISTVAGFNALAGMLGDSGGTQRPTLEFTWTPPDDPTITQVRIFYRIQGATDEYEVVSTDPESGVLRTSENVLPETAYEARATITTVPDRLKSFTSWINTGATDAGNLNVSLIDTRDDMRSLWRRLQAQVDNLSAVQQRLAMDTAIGTGQNLISEAAVKRVQNGYAVALSELNAEVTVINGQTTALATALTAVEASVDNVTAGGLISFEAQVPPNAGSLSTISTVARATSGGATIQAGQVIEVYDADPGAGTLLKSRIVLFANQIVLANEDGTLRTLPFVFEGGVAKLNGLKVNWAEIEDVVIDSATIGNLTVQTSNLDFSSVTDKDNLIVSANAPFVSGVWSTIGTLVTNNPNPNPVFMQYQLNQVGGRVGTGTSGNMETRLFRQEGSKTLVSLFATIGTGPGNVNAGAGGFYLDEDPVSGTNTYDLQVRTTGGATGLNSPVPSASCTVKMVWWKR